MPNINALLMGLGGLGRGFMGGLGQASDIQTQQLQNQLKLLQQQQMQAAYQTYLQRQQQQAAPQMQLGGQGGQGGGFGGQQPLGAAGGGDGGNGMPSPFDLPDFANDPRFALGGNGQATGTDGGGGMYGGGFGGALAGGTPTGTVAPFGNLGVGGGLGGGSNLGGLGFDPLAGSSLSNPYTAQLAQMVMQPQVTQGGLGPGPGQATAANPAQMNLMSLVQRLNQGGGLGGPSQLPFGADQAAGVSDGLVGPGVDVPSQYTGPLGDQPYAPDQGVPPSQVGRGDWAQAASTPGLGGVLNKIWGLESSFGRNPADTPSRIGPAIGDMQITPDTWKEYARPGEQIRNVQDNRNVGARVAADLWNKSGGNPTATLIGYNAGEGAMNRYLRTGEVPRSLEAPYQRAIGETGRQQIGTELGGMMSQQDQALGRFGASNTLRSIPNPLQHYQQLDMGQLARQIDAANPNMSDAAKAGAFFLLYPMLNQENQNAFNREWANYKEQVGIAEYGMTAEEKQQEFRIRQAETAEERALRHQEFGVRQAETQERFAETQAYRQAQMAQPHMGSIDNVSVRLPSGQIVTKAVSMDQRSGRMVDVNTGQPIEGEILRRDPLTQEGGRGAGQLFQDDESKKWFRVAPDGSVSEVQLPAGARKPGTTSARSPQMLYAQAWSKEHPHATADEFSAGMANFRYSQSVASAFGGGIIGRNLDALNTAADHMLRVKQYADALNNGQIQKANTIANTISKQTGGPEVTSFELGRDIMANEVVRLLTTTGGTEADRQEMQSRIGAMMSPQQFAGVFGVLVGMTGGRFKALQLHYSGGDPAREKEFQEKHLTPEARQVFSSFQASTPDYSWLEDDPEAARAGAGGTVPRSGEGGGTAAAPPPGYAAPGQPSPGTVEDGFVFQGGDPKDPKNWKPQ